MDNFDFYGGYPQIDNVSPVDVAAVAAKAKKRSYCPQNKPFNDRLAVLLSSQENINDFWESNLLHEGQLFQLQKPIERNIYSLVLRQSSATQQPETIENVLFVGNDDGGCFNYVATFSQSKNSGMYQRQAKRVLESTTYMAVLHGKKRSIEVVLENLGWLIEAKSIAAVDKVVGYYNAHVGREKRLHPVSQMSLYECRFYLSNVRPILKAVRVQVYEDGAKNKKYAAISMNSGKMWLLDEHQIDLVQDVSQKSCIMTNFIFIKKVPNTADYMIIS